MRTARCDVLEWLNAMAPASEAHEDWFNCRKLHASGGKKENAVHVGKMRRTHCNNPGLSVDGSCNHKRRKRKKKT